MLLTRLSDGQSDASAENLSSVAEKQEDCSFVYFLHSAILGLLSLAATIPARAGEGASTAGV